MKDVIDYCDRESAVRFSVLPLLAKLGELLEIGTGVFINCEEIQCRYEDPVTGQVFYHDVTFGDNVYIGGNSVLGMGVEFEASSGMGGRSCVYPFTTVKEGTISVGNRGQFTMRRPNTDDASKDRIHSKETPLFWKVMYMLRHLWSTVNVSFPIVVLKTCLFQSFEMLQGYFNPSSVPGILVCFYAAYVIGLFMMAVIVAVASRTIYELPNKLLRGESAYVNSDAYRTWIHHSVMLVAVQLSVLPFIGSSPLYSIFLRFMGSKVGKNFIADNTMVSGIALHLLGLGLVSLVIY